MDSFFFFFSLSFFLLYNIASFHKASFNGYSEEEKEESSQDIWKVTENSLHYQNTYGTQVSA